jgi:hypothetical protein
VQLPSSGKGESKSTEVMLAMGAFTRQRNKSVPSFSQLNVLQGTGERKVLVSSVVHGVLREELFSDGVDP